MSVPVAERVVKLGPDGHVVYPVLPFIRNVVRVEVVGGDGSDVRCVEFDKPRPKPIEYINISDDDDDSIAKDGGHDRKGKRESHFAGDCDCDVSLIHVQLTLLF